MVLEALIHMITDGVPLKASQLLKALEKIRAAHKVMETAIT